MDDAEHSHSPQRLVDDAVKSASALLGLLLLALTVGVGATSCDPSTLGKISSPPIEGMSIADLNALVSECAKYPPNQPSRGPYASAYCDQAITAYDVRTWTTPGTASPATTLPAMK